MNRIEERRNELNISINEICKRVGISRKTYYLYSKVYKPIPSDKLLSLSKCLKCSVDYLLGIAHPRMADISTRELVDVLTEREGVETTIAEPHKTAVTEIEGPAIVLTIID